MKRRVELRPRDELQQALSVRAVGEVVRYAHHREADHAYGPRRRLIAVDDLDSEVVGLEVGCHLAEGRLHSRNGGVNNCAWVVVGQVVVNTPCFIGGERFEGEHTPALFFIKTDLTPI